VNQDQWQALATHIPSEFGSGWGMVKDHFWGNISLKLIHNGRALKLMRKF